METATFYWWPSMIEKEDLVELCRFTGEECHEKLYMYEIVQPMLRIAYCHCCLMGDLIRELKVLRITGIQP